MSLFNLAQVFYNWIVYSLFKEIVGNIRSYYYILNPNYIKLDIMI